MIQGVSALVYKYFFVNVLRFPEKEAHPWDYYAHFILSFMLVAVLFGIFLGILALFSSKLPAFLTVRVAFGAACVITLAGGLIKEVSDWRAGYRDVVPDFSSDLAGVGLAILFVLVALVVVNVIKTTL